MKTISRTKKVAFVLFSNLTILLLCGAMFEGALRLNIINNPQYDRLQIQGKRTQAKYKMLILGDSFIVKNSLLGRSLPQVLGPHDFAVWNLAKSGTGPFEYIAELKTMGAEFKPNVVLLSYYVGNDLTDVQNNPQFNPGKQGIGIDTRTSRSYARSLFLYHYILQNLRALLTRYYYFDYEEAENAGVSLDLVDDARMLKINPWLLKVAANDKNYLLDNMLMETGENMRAWEKSRDLLAGVHEICKDLNAQFIIVIFPRSIQINSSHFEFYRKLALNIDERTLESVKPQKLLMDFCTERRIPCLDLLPAFKTRKSEEFYREKDDHLNENGNRLAERLIVDFVLENTAGGS